MTERLDIVVAARRWIGTPYVHQATTRGAGTDCLGLLRGVWRELCGVEPIPVPAYSEDWSETSGREALLIAANAVLVQKPVNLAAAGDVLLFRMRAGAIAKHIGIAAEVGRTPSFVHAYTGHGVIESPLSEPWARRIVARFTFPLIP